MKTKHFFPLFFCLSKRGINLKVLRFVFEIFFRHISEKAEYFNNEFVFYSINIHPDIMQNWKENI